MPRPLSLDLRLRVVRACQEQDESQADIADRFQVGQSTLEKLWQRFRASGQVSPQPHAGGRRPRLAGYAEVLRALVAEVPDATLAELSALLQQRQGVSVSVPVLSRTLRRWGLPRKKSRCSPLNAAEWRSWPSASASARTWRRWIPTTWSSLMRVA